jgi:hypothetical protein
LDNAANLALHNYTVFANLLALPLLPLLGVVRTYNVLQIGLFALNGWAMFALVRHVARHSGLAWIAGLLFAASPTLVARSTAHASLLAAAPLPLFLLCLIRLGGGEQRRWAVAAGATLAWAALCDPYYAVYCILLAAWHAASRIFDIRFEHRPRADSPALALFLEAAIVVLAAVCAAIALSDGFVLYVGGVAVGMRTAYTPVLLLTVAGVSRLLVSQRPCAALRPARGWLGLLRVAPYGLAAALVPLAPTLYAFALRTAQGRYVEAPVFWRTSTPGVDFLSLVGPNPHLTYLEGWRSWLAGRGGGLEENVASVTISALLVLAWAVASGRFRPSRYWGGLALLAAGLTLGPFVHVAGANTCIPTPWTFLRYVPVLGAARAPARFAILVALAVSVLLALALKALLERYPARRRVILASAVALLLFELFPAPRPLHSAAVPDIYDRIAADPRDVRVLELPFGVRDGLSSFGDFRASSQYFQTRHEKRLIGGYLSRVSAKRVHAIKRRPILAALLVLSEGGTLRGADVDRLAERGAPFVRGARLGYVVIDRSRASQELVDFASRVLVLEKLAVSGTRELYRPLAGTRLSVPGSEATPEAVATGL